MSTDDTPGEFALTDKDLKVLSVVHPTLEKIVRHAATETEMPFMVFEGVRTMRRQKQLKAKGASRTLNSRHLSGHAVDLVPLINGKPVWDVPATMIIAAAMFKAADDLGFKGKMRWGGDWDMDGDYYDSKFYDGPHFELLSKLYPASKPAKRTADYLATRSNATPPSQTRNTPSKYNGKHKTAFAASVQQALNHMGLQTTVDGYYGTTTRNNVKRAQEMLELAVLDGLWGPDTGVAYRKWVKRKQDAEAEAAKEKAKLRQKQRDADRQRQADQMVSASAPAAADSGVVSDDKSTRPVTSREETIDREADREVKRDTTPTPPDFHQEVEDSGGGNTGLLLLLGLAALAILAIAFFA